MSRIIAVLEHCANDSDALFFVDLEKLDLSKPELKQYHDAVVDGCDGCKKKDPKNGTGGNVAMNYNSSQKAWKRALVDPPCRVDDRSEIWEGTEEGPEGEDEE